MRVVGRPGWEPGGLPGQLIPENLVSSLVDIYTIAPDKLILVEKGDLAWFWGRESILRPIRCLITVDNTYCCHMDSVLGTVEALQDVLPQFICRATPRGKC